VKVRLVRRCETFPHVQRRFSRTSVGKGLGGCQGSSATPPAITTPKAANAARRSRAPLQGRIRRQDNLRRRDPAPQALADAVPDGETLAAACRRWMDWRTVGLPITVVLSVVAVFVVDRRWCGPRVLGTSQDRLRTSFQRSNLILERAVVQFTLVGMAVAAEDPAASAAWFTMHFGFKAGVDLGWYVSTQHPDHPNLSLDFVDRGHESWPAVTRGKAVVGTLLAFLVTDVDAECERLRAAGLNVVMPLVTEPWGQRRFQVAGPDGLLIEVLQPVAPDPQWLADNGLAG
jgi:catechol 2,3-dioxygenase-like lactoylglutathione lyase family enzyme